MVEHQVIAINYGVNIRISGEPCWSRYTTLDNLTDAAVIYDVLCKDNEPKFWTDVEIEQINTLDNGDFDYKVIKRKSEEMKQKYHVFSETMCVDDYKYDYNEMKVMAVIQEFNPQLDYEDMCRIASAIYWHWVDGRDNSEDEKYAAYPWLEFQNREEDGYIQKYAQRVIPYFIELYLDNQNLLRVLL